MDDNVSSVDSWEECAIAMGTPEQAMPKETFMDSIPEAMYDNWQLSPLPPSVANRPVLNGTEAIKKKWQAALKWWHGNKVRSLNEALQHAIDACPEVYNADAIEAKWQAALNLRKKWHLQRMATIQCHTTPVVYSAHAA